MRKSVLSGSIILNQKIWSAMMIQPIIIIALHKHPALPAIS
jgi:hypothetical protein